MVEQEALPMRLVVEGLSGSASASNGCYAFSGRVSKGKHLYEQDTGAHVLIWDGEAWTLADNAAPTEKVWAFVCTDDGKLPVGVPSESWTVFDGSTWVAAPPCFGVVATAPLPRAQPVSELEPEPEPEPEPGPGPEPGLGLEPEPEAELGHSPGRGGRGGCCNRVTAIERPQPQVGQEVAVYSKSGGGWISARVQELRADGGERESVAVVSYISAATGKAMQKSVPVADLRIPQPLPQVDSPPEPEPDPEPEPNPEPVRETSTRLAPAADTQPIRRRRARQPGKQQGGGGGGAGGGADVRGRRGCCRSRPAPTAMSAVGEPGAGTGPEPEPEPQPAVAVGATVTDADVDADAELLRASFAALMSGEEAQEMGEVAIRTAFARSFEDEEAALAAEQLPPPTAGATSEAEAVEAPSAAAVSREAVARVRVGRSDPPPRPSRSLEPLPGHELAAGQQLLDGGGAAAAAAAAAAAGRAEESPQSTPPELIVAVAEHQELQRSAAALVGRADALEAHALATQAAAGSLARTSEVMEEASSR
jgi:hypothetical protein